MFQAGCPHEMGTWLSSNDVQVDTDANELLRYMDSDRSGDLSVQVYSPTLHCSNQ